MKRKDSIRFHLLQSIGKLYRNDQRERNSVLLKLCLGSCLLPPLGFFPLFLASPVHPFSLPLPAIPSTISSTPFSLFDAPRFIFAGLHFHLRLSPSFLRSFPAWSSCCHLHPSAVAEINIIQFGDISNLPSHVCDPVLFIIMASAGSKSYFLSHISLGSGLLDALQYLLLSVSGIEEGSLLGLPWQVLPLTRSVVKERLAIAAFYPCSCNFLIPSQSATSGKGFLSGNCGSSLVIGCRCTGWKAGDVGTLTCGKSEELPLQKELLVLRTCCNNLVQAQHAGKSTQAVQLQLARLTLLTEVDNMAQAGDNGGMADIKKNLRRMYELLSISVMDNREMAKDIKKMEDTVSYTSYQISNHDARIEQ